MPGPFDDLIPKGSAAPGAPGPFDDLIPKGNGGSAMDAGFVHAGDAATFGMLPKAVAGVMHLTTGRSYDDLLAAAKQVMSQEKAAHPVASGVGTVGGAVLNPANLLLPGVGEGTTAGSLAVGGLKAGAAAGALDAAGHSDGSLVDRLEQTAGGAAAGGATGGLLGAASGVVKPLLSSGARIAQAVAKSGGFEKVQAALDAIVGAGRGNDVVAADLSPHLAKLADQSATRSADAASALSGVTGPRQDGMGERVLGDVRDALGNTTPDAAAIRTGLQDARSKWADSPAGFQGLRDANPVVDLSGIQSALQHPVIQSALRTARLGGELDPSSPAGSLLARIQANNPGWSPASVKAFAAGGGGSLYGAPAAGAAGPLSYADVQAFSQDLDRRAENAFDTKGGGNLGQSLKSIRGAVEGVLAKVPGHSAVMDEYANRSAGIRALQDGQQAFNLQDARGIAPALAKLAPANQDLYRQGLASEWISQLQSKGSNQDVANWMVKGSPATQTKIGAAVNDPAALQDLMSSLGAERSMAQMKGATTGSQTAGRALAARYGPIGLGGTIAGALAAGQPKLALAAGAGGIGAAGASALEDHVAGQTGALLATKGKDAIQQLLDQISGPGLGGTAAQAGTAGVAGLAGSAVPGLMPPSR